MGDILFENEIILERVELISRLMSENGCDNERDMQVAMSLINDLACQSLATIRNEP